MIGTARSSSIMNDNILRIYARTRSRARKRSTCLSAYRSARARADELSVDLNRIDSESELCHWKYTERNVRMSLLRSTQSMAL